MKESKLKKINSKFEENVWKGLTDFPKHLSSRFIYDEKGDKLFQQIMELPDYYLTRCEFNILEKHKALITDYFKADNGFDLIELGAGDGKKTKILLHYLVDHKINFDYLPIDISQHILDDLEKSLAEEIPEVNVKTLQGAYFSVLKALADYDQRKKVIMVLGSNIGNINHEKAIEFLNNIQQHMRQKDMLFMGFDQKKHPQTILDAYNDDTGVTAEFNKNILRRINSELHGNFNLDHFMHWESYNPESGTAKSFLVSKKKQKVRIEKLDLDIEFNAWETIHTEISQKYNNKVVEWLASKAGLTIQECFTDDKQYYRNYVFVKK